MTYPAQHFPEKENEHKKVRNLISEEKATDVPYKIFTLQNLLTAFPLHWLHLH